MLSPYIIKSADQVLDTYIDSVRQLVADDIMIATGNPNPTPYTINEVAKLTLLRDNVLTLVLHTLPPASVCGCGRCETCLPSFSQRV